jgi:hypothetical protein
MQFRVRIENVPEVDGEQTGNYPPGRVVAISDKCSCSRKWAFAATVILGYAFAKQAMEMTKCGKAIFSSSYVKKHRSNNHEIPF